MSTWFGKLNSFLSRLPVLAGWMPMQRFFFFAAAIFILGVTPLVIFLQPTMSERLTEGIGTWCIQEMKINGRDTIPVTHGVYLTFVDQGTCLGQLTFNGNVVSFPGLNSYPGQARFSADDDEIQIDDADSTVQIFKGSYSVSLFRNILEMKSEHVYIKARRMELNLPFQ